MNILFCTPGSIEFGDYAHGKILGVESQVFGLAKALKKRGHNIFIIRRWYYDSPKNEIIEGINIINICSPYLMDDVFQHVFTKLLFSLRMKNEINFTCPDVIILTELFTSFFVSSMKIAKYYVTHNPPADLAPDIFFIKKLIKKRVEQKIFSACKSIIALNIYIYDYLIKNGYPSVLIPNGIELDKYNGNCEDKNFILFGGRLVKLKGVNYIVDAYSLLNEDLKKNYKLVIVGEGPEKINIEHQIKYLDLINYVEQVPWLSSDQFIEKIANCSIFVFPSLFETFGIVIIEAMAMQKVVIASNIPGPQDIIKSGFNGYLFEKGNILEIKKYLELLIKDNHLRQLIGKSARTTIENYYTFDKISLLYEKMLTQLSMIAS